MKAALLIAGIAVLVYGAFWWRDRGLEQRLADVATAVAGREATVDCQSRLLSMIDVDAQTGFVRRDSNDIFLKRSTCDSLRRFLGADHGDELGCLAAVDFARLRPDDYACVAPLQHALTGVGTLAHEAYHVAGVTDEAITECFAIQAAAFTATQLGAGPTEAAALARMQLAFMRYKPKEYYSPECRAGGALDLHPETEAFPSEDGLRAPGMNWRVVIAGRRH